MNQFSVTPKELSLTAAGLRELNGKFRAKINELEESEKTLAAQWEGEAQKAFHKTFESDKVYMEQFAVTIEKYCQTLENIAKEYEKGEIENIGIVEKRSY